MRALQITTANQVTVVDVPGQPINDNDVRVRIDAIGLCGTDFALTTGTLGLNVWPIIPGHEVVGMVTESRSEQFQVGDPVALDPLISCGTCPACRQGHPQWCAQVGVIGVVRHGGAREELVLAAHHWVRLPAAMPIEAAVLVEPVHVVETVFQAVGPEFPTHALMIGSGALGLIILQVIQKRWPKCMVSVHDTVAQRLTHALKLGAIPWQLGTTDSVDLVIDGVGAESSLTMAAQAIRPGGHIVVYGVPKPGRTIPQADLLFRKNVRLTFSRLYTHQFDQAIAWLTSGLVTPQNIISDRLTLEQAATFLGEHGWNRPERWGKTIITMGSAS